MVTGVHDRRARSRSDSPAASRARHYRQRRRDGEMAVTVIVTREVLAWLVRWRWVEQGNEGRKAVGNGITKGLAESARST